MKLHVDPSKVYCINAGTFVAASCVNVCTFSCNMRVGRRQPIVHRDAIVASTGKKDVFIYDDNAKTSVVLPHPKLRNNLFYDGNDL